MSSDVEDTAVQGLVRIQGADCTLEARRVVDFHVLEDVHLGERGPRSWSHWRGTGGVGLSFSRFQSSVELVSGILELKLVDAEKLARFSGSWKVGLPGGVLEDPC